MAHKKSSTTKIDLSEYTATPKPGLEGAFQDVRFKRRVTMPCASLGWCPFGRLAEVFPANDVEAERLGLDDFRYPRKCSRSQKHCPVYYLADTPASGMHNPCCSSLLDTAFDRDGVSDCSECRAANVDDCPLVADSARESTIDMERIALGFTEAKLECLQSTSVEQFEVAATIIEEMFPQLTSELSEKLELRRIALGG